MSQLKEIIHETIQRLKPEISEKNKNQIESTLVKLLEERQIPQRAFGITDEVMEKCYKQGYDLFKSGKYLQAIKVFDALRYLNLADPRYSLALAACYHYLKEHEKAASNYMICRALDPLNPLPSFHLYDCLMKLNQPVLAVDALAQVIACCQDQPIYQTLYEKALLEKENLMTCLEKWTEKHQ